MTRDGVQVTPVPQGGDASKQAAVEAALAKAKPYLGALAVANTPSRKDDVIRGLKRLEVVTCSELILRYAFRGDTIDRAEATSFIAVRQEQVRGAVRRNIGTAHLEVSPAEAEPDWYTFGPQLAQFLKVPTGDAFAGILKGTSDDRRQYLASRRIPMEAVEEMRAALDQPIEDEFSEELFDFLDGEQDPRSPERRKPIPPKPSRRRRSGADPPETSRTMRMSPNRSRT